LNLLRRREKGWLGVHRICSSLDNTRNSYLAGYYMVPCEPCDACRSEDSTNTIFV